MKKGLLLTVLNEVLTMRLKGKTIAVFQQFDIIGPSSGFRTLEATLGLKKRYSKVK